MYKNSEKDGNGYMYVCVCELYTCDTTKPLND